LEILLSRYKNLSLVLILPNIIDLIVTKAVSSKTPAVVNFILQKNQSNYPESNINILYETNRETKKFHDIDIKGIIIMIPSAQ
jgi:hypothetical protein